MEWLVATSSLRSLRSAGTAQEAWAAIFERHTRSTVCSSTLKRPSYDTLRKLRVRFDCMLMLAFRHYYRDQPHLDQDFYVWNDASPQWRGKEMLAASWDTVAHFNDSPFNS